MVNGGRKESDHHLSKIAEREAERGEIVLVPAHKFWDYGPCTSMHWRGEYHFKVLTTYRYSQWNPEGVNIQCVLYVAGKYLLFLRKVCSRTRIWLWKKQSWLPVGKFL